jgi:hypothetical protein
VAVSTSEQLPEDGQVSSKHEEQFNFELNTILSSDYFVNRLSTETEISLRITGSLDFVHHLEFYILENTTFRKLDLFPSSGELRETPTVFGSLRKS